MAGHEVSQQSNFAEQIWIKEQTGFVCWDCNNRFIWHLDLKWQDMKYHHNVILKSNFESKSEQDSCVGIVTRGLIWHLDLKVQDMNQHHKVLHFQVQMSNWTSCYNPNTWILFALWFFKITLQYDVVVILQVLHFQVHLLIEPLVTIPTHESCLLFDSKLLCSMTLWWYFKSCTFKSRC